jgi:hypothetical protein
MFRWDLRPGPSANVVLAGLAIPGHGPAVTDVPAAVERTLARYERFRAEPEKAVGHAVRRAVVSHVVTAPVTAEGLARLPWAQGAAEALKTSAAAIVEAALEGLEERGDCVLAQPLPTTGE